MSRKYAPIYLNFLQSFIFCRTRNKRNVTKIITQFKSHHTKIITISTGLAFVWPVKKQNKEQSSNIDVTPVLVTADNLFENGHYEECYNLLSSCKVSYFF
ncbi:unnamed protein product [Diatraea saccharalis]|uniref:Uncharacterized protein n=1 Tax=Diatraea saccharalis TaxID=40085 RepID=A0A9N9RGR1_9NEOP|nr:unnamed protein product [Diatraea saccharalis]